VRVRWKSRKGHLWFFVAPSFSICLRLIED
jgi:hypothetical protein